VSSIAAVALPCISENFAIPCSSVSEPDYPIQTSAFNGIVLLFYLFISYREELLQLGIVDARCSEPESHLRCQAIGVAP
jgi:hypothetical protein